MNIIEILRKNFGETDINKPLEEIREILRECFLNYSIKSAEWNNCIDTIKANLSQKGLFVYKN